MLGWKHFFPLPTSQGQPLTVQNWGGEWGALSPGPELGTQLPPV